MIRLVTAAAVVCSILGGAASAASATSEPPSDDAPLAAAADLCGADDYLKDDGHSIVFDGIRSGDSTGQLASACVIDAVLPEFMIDVIASTTSLYGLVRNEVSGLVVLNTYHPDNGMFLVIYEVEYFQGVS